MSSLEWSASRRHEELVPIGEAAAGLPGPWQTRDRVTVNEAVVRIGRLEGKFP
jgi:hypothetical protein